MIKTETYYQEPGPDFYKEARKRNRTNSMIKNLQNLGYEVKEKDIAG
jgi:hypothetical protein